MFHQLSEIAGAQFMLVTATRSQNKESHKVVVAEVVTRLVRVQAQDLVNLSFIGILYHPFEGPLDETGDVERLGGTLVKIGVCKGKVNLKRLAVLGNYRLPLHLYVALNYFF